MGLYIRIPGMKDTYNWGYIVFGAFRMRLADAYNKEMGSLYRKWYDSGFPFNPVLTDEEVERYNELCNPDLDLFLLHSDCDGKLTPKECKKIYKAIKNLKMDMMGHNYGDMKPYNMLERFKMMFLHCWKFRVNMYFE